MPSYLITGANRGLGYGFIQVLAKDSANVIIGLVRNKAEADKKLAQDGYTNVTFLQADITDRKALAAAATETQKITGGQLDFLINNAALIDNDNERLIDSYAQDPETFETELFRSIRVNVVGVVDTISTFLPLLKSGSKVVLISSGMADPDLINYGAITDGPIYSISKAAANTAIYKFNATLKSKGILFIAISPGVVATWQGEEEPITIRNLRANAPGWAGPLTPVESATKVLAVTYDFSLEKGNGGAFVSHHGNKDWM